MENFKYYLIKILRSWITKVILSLLVGVGIMCLLAFVAFKDSGINKWCDSTFITFFIIFGFGCLSLILNLGTFDLAGYAFSNLFSVIIHKDKKKYIDAIDYKNSKVEKRKTGKWNFLCYIGVSILFLIAAIVLYIYIKTNY